MEDSMMQGTKRTIAVGRRLMDGWWQVRTPERTVYWGPPGIGDVIDKGGK
jgi:hypothetical protein